MKRWMKYIRPYLPYFILGPLCMIVEVIGEVVMPKLLSVMIKRGEANPSILTPGFALTIMGIMIVTALIMMAGGIGGAYFGAKASVNFAADLRKDLYTKVQSFSFAEIDRFSTGSLVTRLTNDVTQLQNFVNMLLRMALRSPGIMICALIMAIFTRPSLSVVLAVSMPCMLLAIFFIIRKGFSRFSRVQTKIDALNNTVQENITNVRVVKSFVREDFETVKFQNTNSDLKQTAMGAMRVMIFMQPINTFFMYATTIAVLWIGGKSVVIGGMNVSDLTFFVNCVTQILSSLMMITMLLMTSSRALASAKRICEVLDTNSVLSDENATQKQKAVTKGEIEFKNVSFRYYKENPEEVLSDISFKIPAGATVGIIGSTGCGKTSLISLIPRLYDADEGEVLVDGVNVKEYSLENLREGIGVVLQKNTLFSGTIAENLRWGDDEATDEEVSRVAEQAQADKFVRSFPQGYETMLDQGGTNVSGGQKQRLCIARTLLKKPKIIILDDSTSAVDTATEAQIRRAFREELTASTKIIIAQRIGSVKDADIIFVMNGGRITGMGTHSELLESNAEYKEIFESQTDPKSAEER
ncbi:MAG: ABC transporter ATP-binding protein [Clostridia bacterium]|nr:ABC transporter ATP-binding protein [Clostridia bacterium]